MCPVKTDTKRWSPSCRSVLSSPAIVVVPALMGSVPACAHARAGRSLPLAVVRGAPNCRRDHLVLPADHRLRSSAEFALTVRRGVRVGRPTLVVHAWRRGDGEGVVTGGPVTRVGFVVSSAVGGAVVRNRVKRRMRALSRPLVMGHPNAGCSVVVRALPSASGESSRLGDDLTSAFMAALARVGCA